MQEQREKPSILLSIIASLIVMLISTAALQTEVKEKFLFLPAAIFGLAMIFVITLMRRLEYNHLIKETTGRRETAYNFALSFVNPSTEFPGVAWQEFTPRHQYEVMLKLLIKEGDLDEKITSILDEIVFEEMQMTALIETAIDEIYPNALRILLRHKGQLDINRQAGTSYCFLHRAVIQFTSIKDFPFANLVEIIRILVIEHHIDPKIKVDDKTAWDLFNALKNTEFTIGAGGGENVEFTMEQIEEILTLLNPGTEATLEA